MKAAPIAGLLLAASAPVQAAAVCPDLVRLRADPRWRALDSDNCELCNFADAHVGPGRELRWNGRRITEATLRHYLRLMRSMEPRPVVRLSIGGGADCAAIARIGTLIAGREQCGPNNYCPYGFARTRRRR